MDVAGFRKFCHALSTKDEQQFKHHQKAVPTSYNKQ